MIGAIFGLLDNPRAFFAVGIALICAGYVITQFVALVLEDAHNDHEAAQGPAYDARTVEWLKSLRERDSEFDEWTDQALAIVHDDRRPAGNVVPLQRGAGELL